MKQFYLGKAASLVYTRKEIIISKEMLEDNAFFKSNQSTYWKKI